MKKYFILLSLTLLFLMPFKTIAQNDMKKTTEMHSSKLSLEGVWQLISFYNYGNNGTVDTIMSSNSYKQIKMYSKTKVMWSRFAESDSTDWFGYGNYTITETSLTEALDYGSKSMNPVINERETFNFDLILKENTFTQIEKDQDGNPLIAENYIRIE